MNLDHIEFSFLDDVLSEMRLTPDKIELPIPSYFVRDRKKEIHTWRKLLRETLAKMGPVGDKGENKMMDRTEAVKMLQVAERGRQGRLR